MSAELYCPESSRTPRLYRRSRLRIVRYDSCQRKYLKKETSQQNKDVEGKAMSSFWTRREFLSRAAGSAASLALVPPGQDAFANAAGTSGLRGRFVTHVSVVRVNQIEVTPTRRPAAACSPSIRSRSRYAR